MPRSLPLEVYEYGNDVLYARHDEGAAMLDRITFDTILSDK
jgi:hypothetical protein